MTRPDAPMQEGLAGSDETPSLSMAGPMRVLSERGPRVTIGIVVSMACLAAVVVVSLRMAPEPAQVRMRNGSVWVASNQVGEVTLLDGIGAEVGARISVTSKSARLAVQQADSDVYVINQLDGDLTRIDGATRRPLPLVNLMAGAVGGAAAQDRLLIGRSTIYQLNPTAGLLAAADPRDLTPRGRTMTIQRGSSGFASRDGLVWLLNPQTGELHKYGGAKPESDERYRFRPIEAQHLVNVAGRPALLSYHSGYASLLDPDTGEITDTLAAELTERDITWGSDETQRLVVVRPTQGAVSVCRFGERTCRAPIYLTQGAASFGAAVEIDDHVLVPDFGAGRVWIVDLARMATVAQVELFAPQRRPERFDLLPHDGMVFFNDPDSERAGVIQLDGTVRHITKYNPLAATMTAISGGTRTNRATFTNSPAAHPGRSGTPSSTGAPRTTRSGAPQTGSGIPAASLSIVRLDSSPSLPEIGEVVTVSAVTTGGTPQQWHWTIRRADNAVVTASGSPQLTHTFDAAGTYNVALTISDGRVSDTHSEQLTVTLATPPLRCGDTITASVRLRTDLICPPGSSGFQIGADNVTIDLGGHTLSDSNTQLGVGIQNVGYHNLTIRNGTIHGFEIGVQLVRGQFLNLINLRVIATHWIPRLDDPPVGVSITKATGVVIQGGVIKAPIFHIDASGSELLLSGVELSNVDGWARSGGLVFIDSGQVTIEHSRILNLSEVLYRGEGGGGILVESSQIARTPVFIQGATNSRVRDSDLQSGGDGTCRQVLSLSRGIQDAMITGNRFTGCGLALENGEYRGVEISLNTFLEADMVGVYISIAAPANATNLRIVGNSLTHNGHRSAAFFDGNGRPVDDGLHITAPRASDITVADNHSSGNADYGIEADPGTVVDGGGNASSGDPNGCRGVACA